MMSWYSRYKDTTDLVVHLGVLESAALLVRFVNDKPAVYYFRAPHELEGPAYFKINKSDPYSRSIEVPPVRYKLILSEIPKKQVVFGYIDMESGGYYDKRDSTELRRSIRMKFYFASQYVHYSWSD